MTKFKADKSKPTIVSPLSVNVNKGAVKGGPSRVTKRIKQKKGK